MVIPADGARKSVDLLFPIPEVIGRGTLLIPPAVGRIIAGGEQVITLGPTIHIAQLDRTVIRSVPVEQHTKAISLAGFVGIFNGKIIDEKILAEIQALIIVDVDSLITPDSLFKISRQLHAEQVVKKPFAIVKRKIILVC